VYKRQGLVVALAELGGDTAQISMAIPKVVTGIFKGILLFLLLAGETLTRYQLVWVGRAGQITQQRRAGS